VVPQKERKRLRKEGLCPIGRGAVRSAVEHGETVCHMPLVPYGGIHKEDPQEEI